MTMGFLSNVTEREACPRGVVRDHFARTVVLIQTPRHLSGCADTGARRGLSAQVRGGRPLPPETVACDGRAQGAS